MAVEVTGFYHVAIGQDEGANPNPGQGDGHLRSQSTQAGYPHGTPLHLSVNSWAMPSNNQAFKLPFIGDFPLFHEDHFIAIIEGNVFGNGKAIVDDQVCTGMECPFEIQKPCIGGDLVIPFIDFDGYGFTSHFHGTSGDQRGLSLIL